MRDEPPSGRLCCSCGYDAAASSASVAWKYIIEDDSTATDDVSSKPSKLRRIKSASSSSSSEPKLGMRMAALLAYREDALKRVDSISQAAAAASAISGTFGLDGAAISGGVSSSWSSAAALPPQSSAALRRSRSHGRVVGGSSAWKAEASKAGADAAAARARRAQSHGATSPAAAHILSLQVMHALGRPNPLDDTPDCVDAAPRVPDCFPTCGCALLAHAANSRC